MEMILILLIRKGYLKINLIISLQYKSVLYGGKSAKNYNFAKIFFKSQCQVLRKKVIGYL